MENKYHVLAYTKQPDTEECLHVLKCEKTVTVEMIHDWLNELPETYGPTTKISIVKLVNDIQKNNVNPDEIEINVADIRVDCYEHTKRSGFDIRLYTAVRITHVPSGIFAESENGRSQHQNRTLATGKLRKKLQNYYAGETK